ncbi:MAG TPA: bifunctional phosphopantothenoylcysteine decarboxylase/phosphopantothenate--cysteine ligase CoaBC [Solirubrobacteraceae bacterium]|nr:bifunctional phosphopantothenoylcysteine decarboxylase/phosphopantothenate--cysteine ligase CoaBC [Solirubrobacteraceae bacterium]
MARLLLGVCGGIAAYKGLELARLAVLAGHAVRVVQTPTSARFVGPPSFAAITGAPVLSDEFERDPARGAFPDQAPPDHEPLSHLELVRNADVFMVAPASANTIAKLAHGLADNLLTSAALAASCPLIVAPAMNNQMWEHAATRANVERLRERDVTVLEPDVGALGSKGEWGPGRLPDPAALLEVFEAVAASTAATSAGERARLHSVPGGPGADWTGVRVLATAGGTREPIDAVRYVGNRSSGRMGFALAQEAARRGALVTLIAANVDLPRPGGVELVEVETAAQLDEQCRQRFANADVLLMAAAVADYRPAEVAAGKLKKNARKSLALTLERTQDVLSELAAHRRPGQTLVGFAAEHGEGGLAHARDKLVRKQLDAVVFNDVSVDGIGFDATDNEVTILLRGGSQRDVPRAAKQRIAAAVLDAIGELRATPGPAAPAGGTRALHG